MALFLLSVKPVSRNQGGSAIAAAAYQSGQALYNECDNRIYDYTQKKDIDHVEILLPDNAPCVFLDRQVLWNEVEKAEKRADARTAREIILALPRELNFAEQKDLLIEFVSKNMVHCGMCADVAIHFGGHSHNPHAHILLTTRVVCLEGFGLKNRDWDRRENVTHWREQWAKAQNREFMMMGIGARVAHKSYFRRGMNRIPTFHLGPVLSAMEQRGIHTRLGDINRAIIARNEEHETQKRLRRQEQDKNRERGQERSR